jgi:hypothetical protein
MTLRPGVDFIKKLNKKPAKVLNENSFINSETKVLTFLTLG